MAEEKENLRKILEDSLLQMEEQKTREEPEEMIEDTTNQREENTVEDINDSVEISISENANEDIEEHIVENIDKDIEEPINENIYENISENTNESTYENTDENTDADSQENFREELNQQLLLGIENMIALQKEDEKPSKSETVKSQPKEHKEVEKHKKIEKHQKAEKHQNTEKHQKDEKHQNTQKHPIKKQKPKKKKKVGKSFRIVLTVFLGILLLLVVMSVGMMVIYIQGKNHMTSSENMVFQAPEGIAVSSENNGRTITYENKDYQYRSGTTNLLLIGKNPDHTFSTVVLNFNEKAKTVRYMPVPAEMVNIDYTSAMNYSDIAEYVSEFMCGLPIQRYMVLDMQVVDHLLQMETERIIDDIQIQKLIVFAGDVLDNASENWMIPMKIAEEFQDSFCTNLKVSDLMYTYTLFVQWEDDPSYEYSESTDLPMFYEQMINTFYDEKV